MAEPGVGASAFLHTATNSVFAFKGIAKIMRPKGSIYISGNMRITRSQRVSDNMMFGV